MSAADVAARLPEIEVVRAWTRSLAVLDAVMSPEWESRYFSFDTAWGVDEMAPMRKGSGDEYSIVFDRHGAFIRGFDHESPLSPWAQNPFAVVAGLLDDVPDVIVASGATSQLIMGSYGRPTKNDPRVNSAPACK